MMGHCNRDQDNVTAKRLYRINGYDILRCSRGVCHMGNIS